MMNDDPHAVALRAVADHFKKHPGIVCDHNVPSLEEKTRRQNRIEELTAEIDNLAADDNATYQRFQAVRDEFQKLGMMAPQHLIDAVADAFAPAPEAPRPAMAVAGSFVPPGQSAFTGVQATAYPQSPPLIYTGVPPGETPLVREFGAGTGGGEPPPSSEPEPTQHPNDNA